MNITDEDTAIVTLAKITDGVEAAVPTNALFRVTQTAAASVNTVVSCTVGGCGNVIGNKGTTGFTHGVNGVQAGTGASPINPLLGPLQDNGGPILAQMLLKGSPAINNGLIANLPADTFDLNGDLNAAEALPVDQRGGVNLRQRGPAPEAGAVEAFTFEPTITASPATNEDTQTTSGLRWPLPPPTRFLRWSWPHLQHHSQVWHHDFRPLPIRAAV